MITALLHHFACSHPRTVFLYDARSYLSSTATIAQVLVSFLHGHPDLAPIADKNFMAAIVNDGPILPGTFATIFAIFGHIPQNKDWTVFEIIQSAMHATSAALVYLAARRATRVEAAALVSGCLWATYPAAVIASGRYYNEPLMILLMLASLFFASYQSNRQKDKATGAEDATNSDITKKLDLTASLSIFFGSLFSGVVFLMKPALVAGAGISYLAMLLSARAKVWAIILMICGITCAFGPWALYTKAYLGKAYFTTPRNSAYNIAMGNDIEVDGVLTSPMPPLTSIFVNDPQPMHFMYSQWSDNLKNYLTMVLRKATRMYAHPWNDFRHSFFGLDAHSQQFWHLILVFMGLSGVWLFIYERVRSNKINLDYAKTSVFVLSLGWLLAPTIYLLFEANSRYGFSITPFLAIFASLPVARLLAARGAAPDRGKNELVVACAVTLAAMITLLIANLDDLSHWGQSKETIVQLAPHQVACKTITLTKERHQPGSRLFIMVDGDARLADATVTVNDKKVEAPLKHLRYFYPAKYSEYYVFQELGYSMDQKPESYRQWYLVEIPEEAVNWSGDNKIEVRAPDQGLLVYGESDPKTRHFLSPLYYSPIKLGNASIGLETRLVMPEIKADVAQTSSTDDGAGHRTQLPGALRIHIVAADRLGLTTEDKPSGAKDWVAAKHFDVISKDFDPCFSTGVAGELHTSRHVVDAASSVCAEYKIPRSPGSNAVHLKLSGRIKAGRKGSKVGLLLASKNKAGQPVLVSNTPPFLAADPEWKSFTIEDILPDGELAPGPITLTVGIYPGPWEEICGYSCDKHSADAILKDLQLDLTPTYQLDLTKYRLILF
ncbi:MAG: hypothetical protein KGS72_26810 [Cyanobacteria bacterium REEB67]|nr:hypothetical protein [Cyanobacteria bacterium REEB67]